MSDYGLNFLCFFLLCSRRHVLPDGSRQRMTVLLCDCDSSTLFMKWCGRFSLLLHNFLWFWWTWNCTERRWDGNFRHTVVVTLQAERVTRGVMVSRTVSHVSRDPTQSNICPNFHHCSPAQICIIIYLDIFLLLRLTSETVEEFFILVIIFSGVKSFNDSPLLMASDRGR